MDEYDSGSGLNVDKMWSRAEPPALLIRGVSKTFGAKKVLSDAEIKLRHGEIRALVGQNGSGKSTLIKILSGYHEPDRGGTVLAAGEPLPFGSPAAAHRLGFRFVHQDLGLINSMSVSDNIAIGSGFITKRGRINRSAADKRASVALERAGFDIDPAITVSELSAAERTGVAIARALSQPKGVAPRVLVLDEPTASLPSDEVSRLLASLRKTAESGVAIIYVTHHLDEVFALADTVSVLRDGKLVSTLQVGEVDLAGLVHLLIGTELELDYRERIVASDDHSGELTLSVEQLSVGPIDGVSLGVHKGEIVGIYGLTGSGRETILGSIFGSIPREAGVVKTRGRVITSMSPADSLEAGIGFLPADRKRLGGMALLSARENLTLLDLHSFCERFRLRRSKELNIVRSWFNRLEVRPVDEFEMAWGSFSGGNQQKIVLAKWLQVEPVVLLLDDPTQGVDIGARVAIHSQIRDAAERGTSVLIASTDEDELVALCSRVLVMYQGRICEELKGSHLNPAQLNRSQHSGMAVSVVKELA